MCKKNITYMEFSRPLLRSIFYLCVFGLFTLFYRSYNFLLFLLYYLRNNHVFITIVDSLNRYMYRAARFYRVGAPLRVEEMPVPQINDNEALITVRATAMCHSDVHVTTGYFLCRVPLRLDMKSQAI
jgi:hypothetical protein